MLEFYFSGFLIAFIIGVIILFMNLSFLFSVKRKNIEKIGLFYNFAVGNFLETKPNKFLIVFGLLDRLLFSPLLSWIYVVIVAWRWFSSIINKAPIPEKIKEIQFKISSAELPQEMMDELALEIKKFYGLSALASPATLVLDTSSDWYYEVEILPSEMKLMYYSHPSDYLSQFYSTYQYRINGNSVEQKLIEKSSGTCWKREGIRC